MDKPTEISLSDALTISTTLMNNNAKHTAAQIQGENRFGTGPVAESYVTFAHTRIARDLYKSSDFVKKSNYPSQEGVPSAEYGTLADLRILLSTNGKMYVGKSALGNDVYEAYTVGLESYGIVDQDGLYGEFYYNKPIDPLRLNATTGWVSSFAPVLFNDAWVVKSQMTLGA